MHVRLKLRRAGGGRQRLWAPYVLLIGLTLGPIPWHSNLSVSFTAFVLAFVVLSIIGVVYSVKAARHPGLSRSIRRAWRFLAVIFLLYLVGGVAISGGMGPAPGYTGLSPLLAFGLACRVAQIAMLLMALSLFAATKLDRHARRKLAMDVLTMVGGASMLLWYLLIGPSLAGQRSRLGPGMTVYNTVMVLSDLASVVGISTVLLRGTRPSTRRPLAALLTGLITYLLADLYFISAQVKGEAFAAVWFSQLAILVPLLLMVSAAVEQCRMAQRPIRSPEPVGYLVHGPNALPYVALAAGYGVLVVAAVRAGLYPWLGLVVGGLVMTSGVAVRQFIALRENYTLAVTDNLTGIANRVQLLAVMSRSVTNSHRNGVPIAVLAMDLDGFKQVNDNYGHEVGDALLVAFADVLRRTVRKTDTAARLGGDEFVVVLEGPADRGTAIAVAQRILAEMRRPAIINGKVIQMRASIGIAINDPTLDSARADELLHRADRAMYAVKRQRVHGWRIYSDAMLAQEPAFGAELLAEDIAAAEDPDKLFTAGEEATAGR